MSKLFPTASQFFFFAFWRTGKKNKKSYLFIYIYLFSDHIFYFTSCLELQFFTSRNKKKSHTFGEKKRAGGWDMLSNDGFWPKIKVPKHNVPRNKRWEMSFEKEDIFFPISSFFSEQDLSWFFSGWPDEQPLYCLTSQIPELIPVLCRKVPVQIPEKMWMCKSQESN